MQSAVVEAREKAGKIAKLNGIDLTTGQASSSGISMPVVETNGAVIKDGKAYLKGNPLKNTKTILCPHCKLPRLLYPRVGHGARDPPDPQQKYCKAEPPIILDKHDVHGQRKKGTKMKGPAKKKKNDAPSPGSTDSIPSTPVTGSFQSESFEFKTIEYPAAKCPNRDSALGDHWKPVTQMATHLNGNCFLKRDRAAGREAVAKMSGTPADSRAASPKPGGNGKRGRTMDDNDGNGKKRQKMDAPKKITKKATPSPSKLKDVTTPEKELATDTPSASQDISDAVKVKIKLKWKDTESEDLSQQLAECNEEEVPNGVKDNGVKDGATKLKSVKLKYKSLGK
jgi:hypothetical protein